MAMTIVRPKPNRMFASLKRIKLTIPNHENEPAIIAEKAAQLLGYHGAMSAQGVAGALGRILVKLDIRPFDVLRMNQYKMKMKKTAVADRREKLGSGHSITARWLQTPIARYTDPIPDFVLAKAVQIKEECPEAQFFVESLKVNTKVIPDPFLIVKLDREKYWIEVWDEPEFEKGLMDNFQHWPNIR